MTLVKASDDDIYYFVWENTAQTTTVAGSVNFQEILYQYDVSNAIGK